MNKKLIAIVITIVFLVVGLSGCNELDNFITTNNVEVLDYSVISYKFGKNIVSSNIKLGDGFHYKEDMVGFKVSGTIKNNEGEPLKKIKVIGKFYDGNKFLGSDETIIENVPVGETRDFNVFFHNGDFPNDYLLFVDNVKFDIMIEKFDYN